MNTRPELFPDRKIHIGRHKGTYGCEVAGKAEIKIRMKIGLIRGIFIGGP
jgi:hypothetical protein